MKTILTTLLAALTFTLTGSAQTYQFRGHRYFNLGKASLEEARKQAFILGGHLLVVNDAAEYAFIDSTLIKRGEGWYWSGVSESAGAWAVDGGSLSGVLSIANNHWNGTIQQTPVGPGAVMVIGKLQITNRSTKWVAKFYQWNASFAASQLATVIIEIE